LKTCCQIRPRSKQNKKKRKGNEDKGKLLHRNFHILWNSIFYGILGKIQVENIGNSVEFLPSKRFIEGLHKKTRKIALQKCLKYKNLGKIEKSRKN